MSRLWLDALSHVDESAAQTLGSTSPTPLPAIPITDAARDCVKAWLKTQYQIPDLVIAGGDQQADLISPLLERSPTLHVLWVDQQTDRLAAALDRIESPVVTDAIRNGRLVVDPGETEDLSTERFLKAADFSRIPTIRVLEARPVDTADFQMINEMTRAARDLIRWQATDMSTRLRFGMEWQYQTLRNLPSITRHPGIESLFGRFTGMPAIVVAAGPSVDESLAYIKELRNRFVVICVGRILTRLLAVGKVRPHLVITADGQSFVEKHFKYLPAGMPVVATVFSHPDVIDKLDRTFYLDMLSMGLSEWMTQKLGPRGEVHSGGNVASVALGVAAALGCNPVLAVGQDLSYPASGKTHARGKLNEDKDWKLPDHQKYYDIPGNYQPTVKTNRQMMHYVQFTEDLVANNPHVRFINVNTGGARIEGMELIRPEQIADFAAPEPVSIGTIIQQIHDEKAAAIDTRQTVDTLRSDLPVLKSLRSQCLDAAMVCNRMIMLMRRPPPDAEQQAQASLGELEQLDRRLKEDPIIHLLEARLEGASQLLSERIVLPEERAFSPAVRSFRRWREYYENVAGACLWTEHLLADVLKEMEEPTVDKTENNLIEKPETVEVSV